MPWFTRKSAKDHAEPEPPKRSAASPLTSADTSGDADELPVHPVSRRLGPEDKARIALALQELHEAEVDLDDLDSLGTAYDMAFRAWQTGASGEGHDLIVERFAMGIGEHLNRHTDLSWSVVTDVFGTDLGLSDTRAGQGDFVVVPSNLVASRWMMKETGWIPRVVGHLVVRRSWE